jgi:hypothetical protein
MVGLLADIHEHHDGLRAADRRTQVHQSLDFAGEGTKTN